MSVTKWILSGIGSVMAPISPDVFLKFHFRAPKPENRGFRPASDVLEIWPEWRRLRRDGGWDAQGETGRGTENLGG